MTKIFAWPRGGSGGGGGAPTDATYLTGSANGSLSAELVFGTDVVAAGTLAARPAATAVIAGALYVVDSGASVGNIYRSDGATWSLIASLDHSQLTNLTTGDPHTQYALDADMPELIYDTVAAVLDAGTNITLTPDDGTNTITIDAAAGGGTTIVVQEGDTTVDATVGTLDFASADFDVTASPAGEGNVALAAAVYKAGGTDVAVTDGGTGASTAVAGFNALSPLTTRGDLLTRDASNNVRLAKGTSGQLLSIGANDPAWSSRFARVLHSEHNGTAVSNTTTETTLLSAAPTVPTAILAQYDVLVVQASGNLTNNTGGNRTVTFQVGPDNGSTTTFGTGNIATGTTSRIWNLYMWFQINTPGAAGSAAIYQGGYYTMSGVGGSTTWDTLSATGYHYIINAVSLFATNSDQVHDLRVTMSAADFSIDCDSYILTYFPKVAI